MFAFLSTGHTLKQFEDFFWKTPLGRYISEASQEMQMEFFHRYLQDFVSMTMNVILKVDLEVRVRPFQRLSKKLFLPAPSSAHLSTYTYSCVDMLVHLFLNFSSYVEPSLVV